MSITERIDSWIAEGALVGFSPWRDGAGLLFGVIRSREGDTIVVDEIDPFGQEDETETYSLEKISYFDLDETYIERLKLLSGYRPTKRDVNRIVRKRERVLETLMQVAQTGEPVHVMLRADSGKLIATVSAIDDDWVKLVLYNDLMVPNDCRIVRTDLIVGIRAGTIYEERDAYLLGLRR